MVKRRKLSFEQKTLLFSASLSAALGIALQTNQPVKAAPVNADNTDHPVAAEVQSSQKLQIVSAQQLKEDTQLESAKADYAQAQQTTQLAQMSQDQAQVHFQAQSQTAQQAQQLITAQNLQAQQQAATAKTNLTQTQQAAQQQQAQLQAQQQAQQQQLNTTYEQAQHYQQQLQAAQSPQAQVSTQVVQNQAETAYYAQQAQTSRQKLQQQQRHLAALNQQYTNLHQQTQKSVANLQQTVIAQQIRQNFYRANQADLQADLQPAKDSLANAQHQLQQSMNAEQQAFTKLTTIKRQHSSLTPAQKRLFVQAPQPNSTREVVTLTRFQSKKGALLPANLAQGQKLNFQPPKAIAGFALDLDRSKLFTDKESIGSLRDLMEELNTSDPIQAVKQLNASPMAFQGRSQRAILNYVYDRQLTLITKYRAFEPNTSNFQIAATTIDENHETPSFTQPMSVSGYQVDWGHSELQLDEGNHNYLASYLVSANGNGPRALQTLNEDILHNRLAANKLTLTYHYVPDYVTVQSQTPTDTVTLSQVTDQPTIVKAAVADNPTTDVQLPNNLKHAFSSSSSTTNTAHDTGTLNGQSSDNTGQAAQTNAAAGNPNSWNAAAGAQASQQPATHYSGSATGATSNAASHNKGKTFPQLNDKQDAVAEAMGFAFTILGTYGICKIKRKDSVVSSVMPRKY